MDAIPTEIGGAWDAPEAEVDGFEDGFDPASWRAKPEEDIREDGVLILK